MAEASDSCQERLLSRKRVYFPNCPGCKVEQNKDLNPGFPAKDLFRIWIIVLTNTLPISSLFPFLYFMIRDLHVAKTEEDIGYYAGYVGSSYMLGRALTSVMWGLVADRYGRKPVILIGTLTVIIFNTLFGLSVNYWMAIGTRFLLGGLNGLLGAIKAYSTEIFREEYQALGMSTISTAWGAGLILGPALGGFFAQPAEKFPNVFSQNSIFGRFPYFLPCFCISLFAAGVMILSLWLPETLHKHKGNNSSCGDSLEALEAESCVTDENESGNITELKQKPKKSILRNWPLMSLIIVYSVFSLHEMAFSEILSLWAVSPRKFGGLNFSTESVGEVLAISGGSLLVFQIFLYPYFEKILGPVLVCRFAGALTIPLLTSLPYIAMLSGFMLFIVITTASVVKSILAVSLITSLFILQNRAVDQDQRGAANGISMTAMSLFKAIGPVTGGSLFSWAEKRQDAFFLPGTHMLFFILNAIEAIGVLMTFKPFLSTPQLESRT